MLLLTATLPSQAGQGDKPRGGAATPPVKVVPQTQRQSKPQRVEGSSWFARATSRSTDHSARSSQPERTARSARSSRGAEGGRSARSNSSGGSRGAAAGAGRSHGRGH
ncbi:hypothetical protein CLV45_0815 [Hymenobacter chitinivorans DSM 11115]|uniref:Uncharacterized protein n=2 Tax=Hymenobacter chitinivorans TaxID=89969 RepID=A0A2M9BN66_9BACT|nr:hypothetical protein CLV45_0815 [Hymenobacter chitinivorans DSM 11115]